MKQEKTNKDTFVPSFCRVLFVLSRLEAGLGWAGRRGPATHLLGKSLDGALEAEGAGVQLLASRIRDLAQTKN